MNTHHSSFQWMYTKWSCVTWTIHNMVLTQKEVTERHLVFMLHRVITRGHVWIDLECSWGSLIPRPSWDGGAWRIIKDHLQAPHLVADFGCSKKKGRVWRPQQLERVDVGLERAWVLDICRFPLVDPGKQRGPLGSPQERSHWAVFEGHEIH